MDIKVKPGQIWREQGSAYWKILEVTRESTNAIYVNMQRTYRDESLEFKDGDMYGGNPWGIRKNWIGKSWMLFQDVGPVDKYTTVECAVCNGFFVIPPGEEFTNKCPECDNSSTQATAA